MAQTQGVDTTNVNRSTRETRLTNECQPRIFSSVGGLQQAACQSTWTDAEVDPDIVSQYRGSHSYKVNKVHGSTGKDAGTEWPRIFAIVSSSNQ